MATIAVVHGPNLNLLGTREPHIYGSTSLTELNTKLEGEAQKLGHTLEIFQSNHEGVIIDHLHSLRGRIPALVLNAAGLTHTSVVLRDALLCIKDKVRIIEVHLSNPHARESFRTQNFIADIVHGRIEGLGVDSYTLALHAHSLHVPT